MPAASNACCALGGNGEAGRQARRNAYIYCALRERQHARYDRHARDNGLTMQAFLVVNVLYYAPEGLTQARVCEMTLNSRQTVSLVTKRLVAQGYAETEEDPNDRRASVVRLTNAGRTWAHDMVRRITRAEDGAMAALAPEEQEALVSLSRRFTEHLLALIDDPNLKLEEDA